MRSVVSTGVSRRFWAVTLLVLHGLVALSGNGLHALGEGFHGTPACCGVPSEDCGGWLLGPGDRGENCLICQFQMQGQCVCCGPDLTILWTSGRADPPLAAPIELVLPGSPATSRAPPLG